MANDSKNITIVIPTYNEAENIALISQEIFSAFGESPPRHGENGAAGGKYSANIKIIFVDDDSKDGTEKIANSLVRADSRIKFISRKEKIRSFSQSYIEGFKAAFADGADYIIQMDADFSHDPKYLPQMIDNLSNYDIVIGSRYVRGGGVENWSLWRKILSRGSNLYAKTIVGLPVSDPTAGFIAWKKEALQKIELNKIESSGYSFLLEMKFYAQKNKLKMAEIPIIFIDRRFGASKMNKKLILEAALFCWKLKLINIIKSYK